jgi:hypothetical protein
VYDIFGKSDVHVYVPKEVFLFACYRNTSLGTYTCTSDFPNISYTINKIKYDITNEQN